MSTLAPHVVWPLDAHSFHIGLSSARAGNLKRILLLNTVRCCVPCLQLPVEYSLSDVEWTNVVSVVTISGWLSGRRLTTSGGPWLGFLLTRGPTDTDYNPSEHSWVSCFEVRTQL